MSADAEPLGGQVVAASRADEIRAIAAGLFRRQGYSATTMADVAEAAGVLPGSLYHHFESKEVIAVELLNELETALAGVGARLEQAGENVTPEEQLVALVSATMAISYEHAAAVRLLAYEPPSGATERLRQAVDLRVPSLDRLWRGTMKELAATAGASASTAHLTRVALETLSLNASTNFPDITDSERLAVELCELILHGTARDLVSDRDLDSSPALRIAKESVSTWGRAPADPDTLSAPADKILAAGRIEFARKGIDATTVRDIARTAGVTMGTLYRHTDSKFTLVRQIIDVYAGHFGSAMQGVLDSGASEPEILDGLAWVFVNASRRFRYESDMVKVGWLDRDDVASPYFDYFAATQRRLRRLEQLLDRGAAAGRLRPIARERDTAAEIRFFMWLPYQDVGRPSIARTHAYVRHIVLDGFLSPRPT